MKQRIEVPDLALSLHQLGKHAQPCCQELLHTCAEFVHSVWHTQVKFACVIREGHADVHHIMLCEVCLLVCWLTFAGRPRDTWTQQPGLESCTVTGCHQGCKQPSNSPAHTCDWPMFATRASSSGQNGFEFHMIPCNCSTMVIISERFDFDP